MVVEMYTSIFQLLLDTFRNNDGGRKMERKNSICHTKNIYLLKNLFDDDFRNIGNGKKSL
jgi:hypothetical protein